MGHFLSLPNPVKGMWTRLVNKVCPVKSDLFPAQFFPQLPNITCHDAITSYFLPLNAGEQLQP